MDSVNLAKEYLDRYIKRSAPLLQDYLGRQLKQAQKISRVSQESVGIAEHMVTTFENFLGGKNIRGALIYLGYEVVRGEVNEAILRASTLMAVIHAAILMHDDFMDEDDLRRGMPTIHRQYEQFHRSHLARGNPRHYGDSMAVNLGDDGYFMGIEILASAKLPPIAKIRALVILSRLIQQTAFGQAMDVTYELFNKVTEEDVLRIHTYKTAFYTVAGPLTIGSVLAGAPDGVLAVIGKYGQPVGVAFQLRDDELGLFSTEEKTGKPVGNDIRENKNTILKIKAVEFGNAAEKEFLRYAYGNKQLTADEIGRVQEITKKTGALEYSQRLSRQLIDQGKRAIPKITKDPKYQKLLASFAELMIVRDS